MTQSHEVDAIDLSSRAFWATTARQRDESFATLRAERPLSFHPPVEESLFADPSDPGFWAVVRHADIVAVSRRSDVFVSGQGVLFESIPPDMLEATQSFLAMDDPQHAKIRGIVRAAFTPKQIERIESQIRATATDLVAALPDSGPVELVAAVSSQLPMRTICDMIGIPVEQRQAILGAVETQTGWGDPDILAGRDPMAAVGEAIMVEHATVLAMVAERREHPTDDLVSALVAAEVDGERLTDAEISAFFVLLCVAGNDTTRQTITHGALALASNPDQRDWLLEDLDGRLAGAVEELLRWSTPVMTFRRTVAAPTSLAGRRLEAGERVVMFYASGNFDEAAFADPWRLDLSRVDTNHVTFGGGGPHYCLGHFLARTQLRSLFRELLVRFPAYSAGEPRYLAGNFIHGVKSLELTL